MVKRKDPVLDEPTQKILNGLLESISKQPPAEAPRRYRKPTYPRE